jgi:hypothetical protein
MLTRAIASMELVALLAAGPPPSADPWGSVDCSQNPGPGCDLVASHTSHGPSAEGGQGGGTPSGDGGSGVDYSGCRFDPVDFADPGKPPPQGPGGWFMITCPPDFQDGPVWIANGTAGPALSPAQVAQMARKQLRLPQPRIAASPTGDQLVNLPTWLWLSEGWRQVSASASVPGVSVTAVAQPTSVEWSTGDGSTVTCTGAGTPFRAGITDPRSPSPDCGHTYRVSSANQPGQAFPVTATVRWTVTWSGAGQSGTFPDMTTTRTAAFRVAESQALNNG